MSNTNNDSHKKSTTVLEKLGQKITNFKEDIADNIERLKHNNSNHNQTHSAIRSTGSDESVVIEKKSLSSSEHQSGKKLGKYMHIFNKREQSNIKVY